MRRWNHGWPPDGHQIVSNPASWSDSFKDKDG